MGVRHTETSVIIWTKGAGTAPAAQTAPEPKARDHAPLASVFGADQLYDAGDKGCAFGPMDEIAALIRKLQTGQTLEIRATDPSVAFDLGAWCRMTGNALVAQQDDRYLVKKS